MDALPATWTALCALAFVLGLKHGFDADHLATIDGLTRYNARVNPRLARVAGALFSLGHGIVVVLVALVAGTLSAGWQTPGWLELTGAAVSVVFLFGLAFVNVRAVLTTHPDAVVAPGGIKARLLGRVLTVRRPWGAYTVLEEGPGFKIKRIEVNPGGRLSLQSHDKRSEHWVVVAGEATVTRDGEVVTLRKNQSTYVPVGARHRLENLGADPVHIIEVQVGDYVGEDDIHRYDDHYGR